MVELLASLRLAVLLIAAVVVVLAWATIIEQRDGGKAAWFAIYGAWWFAGLLLFLGVNVLFAALIRFPWKRHQTGFVITHAGILVLLAGCLLTRLEGIDAQMPIYEGTRAHRAFEETQHFELTVTSSGRDSGSSEARVIRVPFVAGPFNWDDYADRFWFPWHLARRDRGVVYDAEGIRIEVLDYCSDAQFVPFDDEKPPLRLQVKVPPPEPSGSAKTAESSWQSVGLVAAPHGRMDGRNRASLPGGRHIVFWVAGSQAETEAFLDSRPQGPTGDEGLLVIHAAGRRFEFAPESLAPQQRVPLGDTGLELERVPLSRRLVAADLPVVDLRIHAPGESAQRMLVMADAPELNRQDSDHAVFATYWRSTKGRGVGQPGTMAGPRIDLLQGADRQLYYRTWNAGRIEGPGRVPVDRGEMVAFDQTGQTLRWRVEEFTAQDRPGQRMVRLPFRAKQSSGEKTRLARVRLTVDGRADEFWLEGLSSYQAHAEAGTGQRAVVVGDGRRAAVTLRWDSVDLGFSVYLHEFHRGLDPGTSTASKYASRVDFVRRAPGETPGDGDDFRTRAPPGPDGLLEANVEIAVNRPKDFLDPATGRSYRLFQESFSGPWKPGDPVFDSIVGADPGRDRLFVSIVTVNYDPGRGLKYLGSLLIVLGVGVMFFMRAYFFKRRGPDPVALFP